MRDLFIKTGVEIPLNELEISTSKSGGAGGQHVNKTETKVIIKWNIKKTQALNKEQKIRIMEKLSNKITKEGEILVQNSQTRSRNQNKENALNTLAKIVKKALYVPKKRMKTRVPEREKEKRLKHKKYRSEIKKMRSKKI